MIEYDATADPLLHALFADTYSCLQLERARLEAGSARRLKLHRRVEPASKRALKSSIQLQIAMNHTGVCDVCRAAAHYFIAAWNAEIPLPEIPMTFHEISLTERCSFIY